MKDTKKTKKGKATYTNTFNGLDSETIRGKAIEAMQKRATTYISAVTSSAGLTTRVYAPWDSPEFLYQDVMYDPVLTRTLWLISRCVAGLGFYMESLSDEKKKESEKLEARKTVNRIFEDQAETRLENFVYDNRWSGMGGLLISYNSHKLGIKKVVFGGKSQNIQLYEIHKIAHLNRMKINRCIPDESKKDSHNASEKTEHQHDIMWPKYMIKRGGRDYCYAKSYGDPRNIDIETGETLRQYDVKKNAPALIELKEYFPLEEVYGYPTWRSSKSDVDTNFQIRRYEYDTFKGNCIPNLIIIAPQTETETGETGGDIIKKLLKDTSEQRAGGESHRKAVVMEMPLESVQASSGKFPFVIHELTGPSPDIFLPLKRSNDTNIVLSCNVPPNLVVPYDKAMGSGRDKDNDLTQFDETLVTPLRNRVNKILEMLFREGTELKAFTMKLVKFDITDKKLQAQIANIWDKVDSLCIAEKRSKIDNLDELVDPDDEKLSQAFNKTFIIGNNRMPYELKSLIDLSKLVIGEEKEIESTDGEKMTFEKVFGKADQIAIRDSILPALEKAIAHQKENK